MLPTDVTFTGKGNPIETSQSFLETECPIYIVPKSYELQLSWKHILRGEFELQTLKDFIEEAKVFARDVKGMTLQQARSINVQEEDA